MNKRNGFIIDGEKSIPLSALPDEAWTILNGGNDSLDDKENTKNLTNKIYSSVGVLHRCIDIRSNAMSALPWCISNINSNEIIYSVGEGKLPNELAFLKNFRRMLYLIEASLMLYSRSYLLIEGVVIPPFSMPTLRWLMSNSINPIWDIETGLSGFERIVTKKDKRILPLERVCFFDTPNPLHETVAAISPVKAALNSAGVIYNLDLFAQKFIERGAIKATILTVDPSASPKEREKVREWWKRAVAGIKNAWGTEVLSNNVQPVVIGEGLGEVFKPDITKAKAEEIATTLGVPHSLLFSNSANFATASVDERSLYTHSIIPHSELIEEEINLKLFNPLGYNLSFEPESLRVYQEDEGERANTFKILVESGIPIDYAIQISGIELPDGLTVEQLKLRIEEDKANAVKQAQETMVLQSQQKSNNSSNNSNNKTPTVGTEGPKTNDNTQTDTNTPGTVNNPVKSLPIETSDNGSDEEMKRLGRWIKNKINNNVKSWCLADFKSEVLDSEQRLSVFKKAIKETLLSQQQQQDQSQTDFTENYFEEEFFHEHDESEKSLTLQSNPDDNEEEHKKIISVENKMVNGMTEALQEQKKAVFKGNEKNMNKTNPEQIDMGALFNSTDRISAISGVSGSVRDALREALIEGVDLGVKVSNKQFSSIGFGFNWTLANEKARKWADDYSGELIQGIDNTTLRNVRQQVAQWASNGQPLTALEKELETVFGKTRASLIASTEVTRAYAQGNKISYQESGIVKKIKWRTAQGEMVCPICGSLNNKMANIEEGFPGVVNGGLPPAHPRCRCWIVPIVDKTSIFSVNDNIADQSTGNVKQ